MNQIKGFVLSIVLVIALFLISAISAGIVADVMGVWKKPIIGACAAFCVVMAGYITAPNHKRQAALTWLIVGAIAAWFLSGDSFYPEDHEHEYQLTIIPILATYLSGICALLICLVWHKQRNKK
jgi:O-antigen ligase